jgi:hypothetical protein
MERLAATLPAPSVSSPVDNTLKDTSYLDTSCETSHVHAVTGTRGERQQFVPQGFAGFALVHSVQNAPIDICLSVCHFTTAYRDSVRLGGSDLLLVF